MEVVEEVRIGIVDGPDHYTFSQIVDLAVGSEGSIYVADAHPPSVLQFDRRGRFVRRIGREGAGPGEYKSILGLSMLRGGDLALWDNGNGRISVYDSAGAYLRSTRVAGGAYWPKPFETDTVGSFYVKVRTLQPQILRGGLIGGDAYAYVRISSEGSVLDTVTTPAENPAGSFVLATENGILRPFTIQEVYALSPFGFLVVGSNERYSFTIRDPQSPVIVDRQDFTPVSVKAGCEGGDCKGGGTAGVGGASAISAASVRTFLPADPKRETCLPGPLGRCRWEGVGAPVRRSGKT